MNKKIEIVLSGLPEVTFGEAPDSQPTPPQRRSRRMFQTVFGVAIGVLLAPTIKRFTRPLLRGTVQAGMVVGREIQEITASVKEDFEDVSAEVRAKQPAGSRRKRSN